MAQEIAEPSATACAGDCDNLNRVIASLHISIAAIDGVVERAWSTDRQDRWSIGAALAGALSGIILWSVLPGEVARALPARWYVLEKMAVRILRLDVRQAGECLTSEANQQNVSPRQAKGSRPTRGFPVNR